MEKITFEQLMEKLLAIPEVVDGLVMPALEVSAQKVRKTAVEKFGSYQPAVGEFQAWATLNPDYVKRKVAAGAPGDSPLIGYYADNHKSVFENPLRDSLEIELDHSGLAAYVYTMNPVGKWMEYGTVRVPARPFLRPALYQNQEWIHKTIQESLALGLVTWLR